MASATLSLFCTPEELATYIRETARQFGYRVLAFAGDEPARSVDAEAFERLPAAVRRIFLHPPLPRRDVAELGNVSSREWGWVDIRPGTLEQSANENCLTMSEFAGESSDVVEVQAPKIVGWLKRRLKGVVTFGVRGVNPLTGGGSSYRDIGHTEAARALHASGVAWRQFATHRALFEPDAVPAPDAAALAGRVEAPSRGTPRKLEDFDSASLAAKPVPPPRRKK